MTSKQQRQLKTRLAGGLALPTGLLALFTLTAAGQRAPAAGSKPSPAPPASSIVAAASSNTLFEAKIRPLLLTACVGCHSKDGAGGGLRLDIAPTPAQAQEALRRVKGEGGKARMPLGSELPKDKVAALELWVRAGAHWGNGPTRAVPDLMAKGRTHWAFQPLTRPAVPKIKNADWTRNPIDAFIGRRLEGKELKPAPPASRRDLIRRLTYDLIGLPPTPEEVTAFEADTSPGAYEKLVDRLLASPHYGEKWGRHWLDLVRYAETNSYERDGAKPHAYKYRDYVIRAFNDDKPYDRFVREQIAGDELPDTNGDALTATGYYRLGVWDDEPADPKQAEFDGLDDLVATTGQTFLGLTLDCARCHDHKLDPIPQKDYYRFAAFFRNINRFKNGGPTDEAAYFASAEQKRETERKIAELDASRKATQTQIADLEAAYRRLRPQWIGRGDLADLRYRYFEGTWETIPNFDALKPVAAGTLSPAFLDLRPRRRDVNFAFVFEGVLNVPQTGDYVFFLDSDDGARITVGGQKAVEKNMSGGQGMEQRATLHLAAGRVPFRADYFQGGALFGLSLAWSGPGFARRPLATYESCGPSGLPGLVNGELPQVLPPDQAKTYVELVKRRTELEKQEVPTEKILCVTEAGVKAPDTFTLLRGSPNTPGDKVEPAFPICAGGGLAAVPPPPPGAQTTGRRLALANWLTAPANPLTARVIVNRVWQYHFGRGIVRTPSDFGLQGAAPTHPELLNWLAKAFVAQGWHFKKLHRLIVTSAAYRQSSRASASALARDPQNDLFGRFPMRRLEAEEIRDSLLAVSGSLNLQMYGESVYPEIAKSVLAGQSIPGAGWFTDRMKPEDLNRRSIYIHVKRSLAYPLLAGFDLPETDRPSPVRFASTQPTQALGLMNNPLVNRQAGLLAERARRDVHSPADGRAFARRVLALVLQRVPTDAEIAEGASLMARLQKRGASGPQAQTYFCLMALNLNEFIYLD